MYIITAFYAELLVIILFLLLNVNVGFIVYALVMINPNIGNNVGGKVVIRHDKLGPILWSKNIGQYLLPVTVAAKDAIYKILSSDSVNIDTLSNDSLLNMELMKIGLGGELREVFYNSSKPLGAPLECYFDYTTLCNLSCPPCYNNNHKQPCTMSPENVQKIIGEMRKLGVMRLHLAGGEPTISVKGLENYLSTSASYHILTSLTTNGTLLNDRICDLITDYDLFSVTVSIDGATEGLNSLTRNEGSLSKSITGIKKLSEYKKMKKKDMEICIKPTYFPDVLRQSLKDLILLAISLGVDKIKLTNAERSLFHDLGYYAKQKEAFYQIGYFINELQEEYKDQIVITNSINPLLGCLPIGIPGLKGCIGGQELIAINPDGRISPCLVNDYNLGNIHDWGSLEKFWNESVIFENYLNAIVSKECDNCVSNEYCRGGCQVRKIVDYGKIINRDPFCPVRYKESFTLSDIKLLHKTDTMTHFKKLYVCHSS